MDFQLLQDLGLPGFVITFAAILWIMKIVGLLDYLFGVIKNWQEASQKQREWQETSDTENQKIKRLRQLSEDYSDNWLLEQISQYSSEALVQVGTSNEFIRKEVHETLKALVEKLSQLDLIMREVQQIRIRLGELYTEVDIVNRRLEEMGGSNDRNRSNP